jgi:hypothetical protein
VSTERPLGKIRLDRVRGNSRGSAEPAQAGRHRRPAAPEPETTPADTDR